MNAALQNCESTSDGDVVTKAQVIGEMQAATKEIAERWVTDECRLGESELEVRYKWAQELIVVQKHSDRYGRDAYQQLKEILKNMGQEPIVYDRIASHIDSGMYKKVVDFNKSKPARDFRITWSHLGILSRLSDDGLRRAQLKKCMDGELSVRQLRELASEATKSDPAGTTVKCRDGGVKSTVMRLARQTVKLSGQAGKLKTSLFAERLTGLRSNEIEEAIDACKKARASASDCIEAMGNAIRMYSDAIQDLESRQEQLDNHGCESGEDDEPSDDENETYADYDASDDETCEDEDEREDEDEPHARPPKSKLTDAKPKSTKAGAAEKPITATTQMAGTKQFAKTAHSPTKPSAVVKHQPLKMQQQSQNKVATAQAQQSERPPEKLSPALKPTPGSTAQKKGETSKKKLVLKRRMKPGVKNGPSAATT